MTRAIRETTIAGEGRRSFGFMRSSQVGFLTLSTTTGGRSRADVRNAAGFDSCGRATADRATGA
jgi:hypothetical protein